jgi:hypothetical protein
MNYAASLEAGMYSTIGLPGECQLPLVCREIILQRIELELRKGGNCLP